MALISGNYTASAGRDLTVNLMSPINGAVVSIPNLQSFQYQQETTAINRQRMDGATLNSEIPKGWQGSIEFDRSGAEIDALFAQIQSLYLNSGTLNSTTLYLYVTETGGAQTTLQFDNVSIKLADGGTYKSDAVVTQRITFMANQMIKQ